ncbi:Eco57I restriction-modification methylase domain-containing protein [Crassaminicella profunda]|uniref:Eco57I restriction-modification methylase domain-containing protein n=1 Tax=Crassaminicella profunda TaxID=1286698 RepID=UPI001CA778F4|nr:N-6 DNA methylase [Crassaminicella profunda]QZY56527.1 N-6 DNA methylase [Crassaminicella profunda]
MQIRKWRRLFDEILKNIEDLKIERADFVLEICKFIFLKKYSADALNAIGLSIRDDLKEQFELNEILDLKDYDFTILSHLYENYLSQNRREKTGSFYTPFSIIEYMVERSLEIYLLRETGCPEKDLRKILYGNKSLNRMYIVKILKALDEIKMIDIACGTGLFLIGAFKKIYTYKKNIYRTLGKNEEDFLIRKHIVENNLFGIDLQREPACIGKMALFSLVCGENKEGYPDTINITVADSLTDEKVFEGTKKFDIAIGNPPYLGEKGNKAAFDKIKNSSFGKKYYEGKMDYFYFFIYKSLEILKEKGILSYITTNYFVTADGAVKLRDFLKNHCTFIDIVNFNDYEIFKSAKGQHNIIFFLANNISKNQSVRVKYVKEKNIDDKDLYQLLYENKKIEKKTCQYILPNQEKLYDDYGQILIQENNEYDSILGKLYNHRQYILKEVCNVNQGIVSGADKVTRDMLEKKIPFEMAKKNNIILNQGIFVLSYDEVSALGLLGSHYLKPMYKNSDIRRYCANHNPSKYLLYIDDQTKIEKKVLQHLSKYKEVLKKRRETLRGTRHWYALQWPRNQEIFESTKIIVPHRAKENRFALNHSSWYASADVYFITSKEKTLDFYMLLGLLNSKIMYFWLYNRGKRKGDYLELYATPLKNLPITCSAHKSICEDIKILVKQMVQFGQTQIAQEKIDSIFYDLYSLTSEEVAIIENLYKRNIKK